MRYKQDTGEIQAGDPKNTHQGRAPLREAWRLLPLEVALRAAILFARVSCVVLEYYILLYYYC